MVRQGDGWQQEGEPRKDPDARMNIPSLSQAKEQAKAQVKQAAEGAKEQIAQVADQGAHYATEKAEEGKHQAAEQVQRIGAAVRTVADNLRERGDGRIADYAQSAADRADRMAVYLRDRSLRDMLDDAGRIVRRNPELVTGGLFLAGICIARFLKSSHNQTSQYSGGEMPEQSYSETLASGEGMTEFPSGSAAQEIPAL